MRLHALCACVSVALLTSCDDATEAPATPRAAAVPLLKFDESGRRLINLAVYQADPPAAPAAPQREPDIDQAKLIAGGYPLSTVLEAGQNQFNLPFDVEHGWGEGAAGPRSLQRAVWNPRGATGTQTAWPFLRVDGIDSQSCYECHSSIGTYVPPGASTVAQARKPGAQGGPAGGANTAFINNQFPEQLAQLTTNGPDGKPIAVLTKFARNPPVVFGTGYTQRLATEMTTDLMGLAAAADAIATKNPGTKQTIPLLSKTIEFGAYSVTCKGSTLDTCTSDTSQVTGVQPDLVVRPFQWGGIASSVRHFVRDALDFHFSVQAVEKVGTKDCDLDGLSSEMTVGNVTALTAYVTMFRPPEQVVPAGSEAEVSRGLEVMKEVGCTSCHAATMHIDNPMLTIQTPPAFTGDCPPEVASLPDRPSGTAPDVAIAASLLVKAVLAEPKVMEVIAHPGATPAEVYAAMAPGLDAAIAGNLAAGNYQIDLNLTGLTMGEVPAYVWPRLPNTGGAIEVPLFSDLKLHFMGAQLSDNYPQPTDGAHAAQPGHYVTRVLWGIADTAPYMHDGRARTLIEAITLHGVDGSEAAGVHENFVKASEADKAAVLAFLGSLRLPISEGISEMEYVTQPANVAAVAGPSSTRGAGKR